jgi:hypothetical protein
MNHLTLSHDGRIILNDEQVGKYKRSIAIAFTSHMAPIPGYEFSCILNGVLCGGKALTKNLLRFEIEKLLH